MNVEIKATPELLENFVNIVRDNNGCVKYPVYICSDNHIGEDTVMLIASPKNVTALMQGLKEVVRFKDETTT